MSNVREWQPFRIEALGIITLVGSYSLQKTLGRLVISPGGEYLPLLAAQVVLEDTIGERIPGFTIYNITDGIKAAAVSAWWTRWLLCQDPSWSSTVIQIDVTLSPKQRRSHQSLSMDLSFLLMGLQMAFSLLLGDWYGVACSASVICLVIVRASIMSMYRNALDACAERAKQDDQKVKLLLTTPSGKLITIYTTRGITTQCLLTETRPHNSRLHKFSRIIGWLAFAICILTLGMASSVMQLIFIVDIFVPSILVVQKFCCDEYRVDKFIELRRADLTGEESRAKTYASLELSPSEEEVMTRWEFFPSVEDAHWWSRYKICRLELQEEEKNKNAFGSWSREPRRTD